MVRSSRIFMVAGVVSLALAACTRSEPSSAAAVASASVAAADRGEGTAAGSVSLVADPDRAAESAATGARERKLVRVAALRLEVEDYAAARERVDSALARVGGHVAHARVEHADGTVVSASLELRVPAAALDALAADVARCGTVLHEEMRTDEISESYYDARARLSGARKLEQRLLEFAEAKTSDVNGLLEVERELARVREEIETLAGRIAGYDGQVALSTLSLELVSLGRVSVGEPPGLGMLLAHALRESAGALFRTGRGLLVVFAFLLPWLPLFAAGGYLGRRLLRR